MKKIALTICCILMGLNSLASQAIAVSFFEMALKDDSIYTPGSINLIIKLTDRAKIKDNYQFQIGVYIDDVLIRKQTLTAIKKDDGYTFEFTFPEIQSRTNARCRVELLINGQLIEAKEYPLILWPSQKPYSEKLTEKIIWIFDTSGQLQKAFEDMDVNATDATFQAARSFGTPDIVFIGQNLDPNNMRIITDCINLVNNKSVVIFLQQRQLPRSSIIEIPKEENCCQNVLVDMNSPFLTDLNKFDILDMLDSTSYIKMKKENEADTVTDSCVTELLKDKKHIYSYMLTVEKENKITIYCQLPVTGNNDPRCGILLNNLLKFANKFSQQL